MPRMAAATRQIRWHFYDPRPMPRGPSTRLPYFATMLSWCSHGAPLPAVMIAMVLSWCSPGAPFLLLRLQRCSPDATYKLCCYAAGSRSHQPLPSQKPVPACFKPACLSPAWTCIPPVPAGTPSPNQGGSLAKQVSVCLPGEGIPETCSRELPSKQQVLEQWRANPSHSHHSSAIAAAIAMQACGVLALPSDLRQAALEAIPDLRFAIPDAGLFKYLYVRG